MKEWLIALFIVSLVAFVAKLLLPTKKTHSFLAFLLSVVSLIYILIPTLDLISGEVEFVSLKFDGVTSEYSTQNFDNLRCNYYLSIANQALKESEITINDAQFIFDDAICGKPLKKVKIYYENLVINNQLAHINISLVLKVKLSKIFNIAEENVIIYE